MTFSQMDRGWRSPGTNKESNIKHISGEGFRAALAELLADSYGTAFAHKTTDNFYALWKKSHEEIKVPEFSSDSEIKEYLEITGVVDEEREKEATNYASITMRESLDKKLTLSEESQEQSSGPIDNISTPENSSEDRSDDFKLRFEKIEKDWDKIKGTPTFAILFRKGEFEDIGENTIHRADRLLKDIMASAGSKSSLSWMISELEMMTSEYVYRKVIRSARLISIMGFVTILSIIGAIQPELMNKGLQWVLFDALVFLPVISIGAFVTMYAFFIALKYRKKTESARRNEEVTLE